MTQSDVAVVLTTVEDEASARSLASALIDRRLIACATFTPVESIYRWEGDVTTAGEIQVILKTAPGDAGRLVSAIEANHPYDVPEILVLQAAASRAYAAWVSDEVVH